MIPMKCLGELQSVSEELVSEVQPVLYKDPIDAAKKALDIF